ncbi:unnamed protein product [Durusdinium trenchii]|uniref:Uncharacterized protein n=1 Tax=Durusdinium trenchii TaxID=1381693 RepID=A0ABP0QCE7_9DINO
MPEAGIPFDWETSEASEAGCFSHLRSMGRAARAWWMETTDDVLLNSPWLRRSTGGWFRCLWILFHVVPWCTGIYMESVQLRQGPDRFPASLLVLALLMFARVVYSSLTKLRDTLQSSLLLCFGSLISYGCWDYLQVEPHELWFDRSTFVVGFLGQAFPTLCHCNVHPVALVLLLAYTVAYLWHDFDLHGARPVTFRLLHILGFQCCMCYAFTRDFTHRVKAVSTGMLEGASSDPLQSPVAGRSARTFCWLTGVNNWIFLMLTCITFYLTQEISFMLFDGVLFCVPWIALMFVRRGACTPFQSDLALCVFCNAGPAWAMLRPLPYDYTLAGLGEISGFGFVRLSFYLYYTSIGCTSYVFATQAAIQAGCHPSISLGTSAVMTVFFLVEVLQCNLCLQLAWDFGQVAEVALSLVLAVNHSVDFTQRLRAISAGLEQSAQNAASSLQVLRSHERLGLELLDLASPPPPPPGAAPRPVARRTSMWFAAPAQGAWTSRVSETESCSSRQTEIFRDPGRMPHSPVRRNSDSPM